MKLDENKLKRQKQGYNTWIQNKCIGTMQYPTGFGKTMVIIMAIQDMNTRHPDRDTIILVPNLNLQQDWMGYKDDNKNFVQGHIQKWNLKNVRVFVINTFIKYVDWKTDFFAVDEIHRVLNEDAHQFSKALAITNYRFFMGMSATLTPKQKEFLDTCGIKVIDTITQDEAIRNGWIAPSNTFNLAVKLKQIDLEENKRVNESFNYFFAKLDHEFEFVKACNAGNSSVVSVRTKNGNYLGRKTGKEWREYIARQNKYTVEEVGKYAAQAMYYMRMRRTVLQNYESKLDIVKEIIDAYKDKKIIVFCETSNFADKIAKLVGETAISYHSNLGTIAVKGTETIECENLEHKKKLALAGYTIITKSKRKQFAKDAFNNSDKINHLITVRALDEGADFKKVELTIFVAYNSTERQRVQREGRGLRIDYENLDKKLPIVFLYVEGTQEEKWLKEAQKGKSGVRWIKDVSEITNNSIILADGTSKGTITADEIGIVTNSTSQQELNL
jgi:superfamily II DNA or RNA helicase